MNTFEDDRNRQLVPRWLPFRDQCRLIPLGVHDYALFKNAIDKTELNTKREAWRSTESHAYAVDLVASALMSGDHENEDVRDAARHILAHDTWVPGALRDISSRIVEGVDPSEIEHETTNMLVVSDIASRIAAIKHELLSRVNDPILYFDLAYYYSLLAQNRSAEHAMRIGLALGDENPLLLRSAARFFLHARGDADESLHLLRRAGATNIDPMLMSAEISISEAFGRSSKLKSRARRLLQASTHHAFETSELAATIATLEMNSGASKKAKRAFDKALVCPTENTLAQAAWAERFLPSLSVEDIDCSKDFAFEAMARDHFWTEDFDQALDAGEKWVAFQPFSARPAAFSTFVAGVAVEDHERAISIAKRALLASPESFVLHNNVAFSSALLGNIELARESHEKAKYLAKTSEDTAVAAATGGLIAFRSGDADSGRNGYELAIGEFQRKGDVAKEACARIFHAREELRAHTDESEEYRRIALQKAEKLELIGVAALDQIRDRDRLNPT